MPQYRLDDPALVQRWQQIDDQSAAEGTTTMAIHGAEAEDQPGETYAPEEDVYETLADGRTILKAAKGVPMHIRQAREIGLIKPRKSAGPSEVKGEAADDDQAKQEAAEKKRAEAEGKQVNAKAEAAQHNQPAGAERAPAAEPAKKN